MKVTRYIVDLTEIRETFLAQVYPLMHSTYGHTDMMTSLDFIYRESIDQMVLAMDTNVHAYVSKLDAMLNMDSYIGVPDIMTNPVEFRRLFVITAIELFRTVNRLCNPEHSTAEYIIDGLTPYYVIILKVTRGLICHHG